MTDPDKPAQGQPDTEQADPNQPDEASQNLDTARGDEGEDAQTGGEDGGPILPPNHNGGGYAIP